MIFGTRSPGKSSRKWLRKLLAQLGFVCCIPWDAVNHLAFAFAFHLGRLWVAAKGFILPQKIPHKDGCFRFLSHISGVVVVGDGETKPNTSSQKGKPGPAFFRFTCQWWQLVFFLSLGRGFDFCNFFVSFRLDSFRFLFGVFVLHVVVSFSPLVYNFNKILLTNSGEWSAESAMTRQRKGRAETRDQTAQTVDTFIPLRPRNRYYYYNNNSWAKEWYRGLGIGTVAIACQHCTCRFCSLLCWHCILLRRFDNSFYLRPGRCQGLGLFVCHLRRLSSNPPLPLSFP